MFKYSKGNFKGKFYDTDEPVPAIFQILWIVRTISSLSMNVGGKDRKRFKILHCHSQTLCITSRPSVLHDTFFSEDSAHDLGLSLSQEVLVLKDGSGLMFSHTLGKTRGTGKVNECIVPNIEESLLCLVMAYRSYVNGSLDMGV
jgi:hypothetical protein